MSAAQVKRGSVAYPRERAGGDAQRMSEVCLLWLMQWRLDQCDNDWEHCHGVSIGTLDNPGWTLRIDL